MSTTPVSCNLYDSQVEHDVLVWMFRLHVRSNAHEVDFNGVDIWNVDSDVQQAGTKLSE